MTPGELKFALCVEAALNRIPEPEYRQLVVEMLMVLSLVNEYHPEQTLGDTIDVDELVWEGHNLYLKDQVGRLMPFPAWGRVGVCESFFKFLVNRKCTTIFSSTLALS